MKKTIAVISTLVMVIAVCSAGYAFNENRYGKHGDMHPCAELLSQLPEDKEMLFHQTMRTAREKASAMHAQIKELGEEIKIILIEDPFNEELFREKMDALQASLSKMHEPMEDAVIMLAKQFTTEERKILAELFPHKPGHHMHYGKFGHQ